MPENNKPISLEIHDTKQDIINTINQHDLPASVLLLLMKDIMNEVVELDKRVYKEDMESYASEAVTPMAPEPEAIPEDEVIVEE